MSQTDSKPPDAKPTGTRVPPLADVGLRMGAIVFLIAGVITGFSHPIAIVLAAIGVLLLVLDQSLKNWPRKPAR